MKEKKITITSKDISQKQWAILLLELNLIRKAWRPYAKLDLTAPGLKKIIRFGTRRYDKKDICRAPAGALQISARQVSKRVQQNKRSKA